MGIVSLIAIAEEMIAGQDEVMVWALGLPGHAMA
jgi:hypothetical protein